MGILTRHEDETPASISVDPIGLKLETDHGEVIATPVLVAAVARQRRHPHLRRASRIAKLAPALHDTLRVMEGELTQRPAANKLNIHPIEGMTVVTTLQDVIGAASSSDPDLDTDD